MNESLIVSNTYLNALREAERKLTSARTTYKDYETDILYPKVKASKVPTAEWAARAENFRKFLFPKFLH